MYSIELLSEHQTQKLRISVLNSKENRELDSALTNVLAKYFLKIQDPFLALQQAREKSIQ